jgi:O-antigen/teichoic acid export membrane protein
VADQAVSSLGNVVLTVIVARSVSPQAFGEYAVLIACYQLLVSSTQAVVGEPLLVAGRRRSRTAPDAMAGAAVGLALVVGLLALATSQLATVVFGLGPAPACLGLLMPGLLVQDALRYVAFSRIQPVHALISDVVWVTLQFSLTAVVLHAGVYDVWVLIAAWGAPASVSAVLAAVLMRVRPAPLRSPVWLRSTRHLSGRFFAESAASMGAYQVVIFIAAAVSGVAVAGQLRLVQTIFGPLHVLVTGVRSVSLPQVAERLRVGGSCRSIVSQTAVLLGAAAAAWTATLLLLPDRLGSAAFGAAWAGLHGVILLCGLQKVAESVGTGPYLVHRARQLASWTLRVRLLSMLVMIVSVLALAPRWGAVGAGTAMLLGSALASVRWWLRYRTDARAVPPADARRAGGRHRRPDGVPVAAAARTYPTGR